MKARRNISTTDGLVDAPFIEQRKPVSHQPIMQLPLPDSSLEESIMKIQIQSEESERGVWTIEI